MSIYRIIFDIVLTPKTNEGVGVKLLMLIVARKPGKCPSLAPTKNNLKIERW